VLINHIYGRRKAARDQAAILSSNREEWDNEDNRRLRTILERIDISNFSDAEDIEEDAREMREKRLSEMKGEGYDLKGTINSLINKSLE